MRNRKFLEVLGELKKIAEGKRKHGKRERAAGVLFAVNYMEAADWAARVRRHAGKAEMGKAGDKAAEW